MEVCVLSVHVNLVKLVTSFLLQLFSLKPCPPDCVYNPSLFAVRAEETRQDVILGLVDHINTQNCPHHGDECSLVSSSIVGGKAPFFLSRRDPFEYISMATSSTPTFW